MHFCIVSLGCNLLFHLCIPKNQFLVQQETDTTNDVFPASQQGLNELVLDRVNLQPDP